MFQELPEMGRRGCHGFVREPVRLTVVLAHGFADEPVAPIHLRRSKSRTVELRRSALGNGDWLRSEAEVPVPVSRAPLDLRDDS